VRFERLVALGRVGYGVARGGASLRRSLRLGLRHLPHRAVAEAAFQSLLFCGYPAAIRALRELREITGRTPGVAREVSGARVAALGHALCARVYGAMKPRLLRNMRVLHPLMPVWIVREGYGRMLSRPGLSFLERECAAVGCLLALRAWPQAEPHLRALAREGVDIVAWSRRVAPECAARVRRIAR
jgi:alkylhydroperoxidase/carboxymuconolactone decarboxylase family protein YurZ